jgi:hypothetical protein
MITVLLFMSVALKDRVASSKSTLVAPQLQRIGTGGLGARHLIRTFVRTLRISRQRRFYGIIKCRTGSSCYSSSKNNMSLPLKIVREMSMYLDSKW